MNTTINLHNNHVSAYNNYSLYIKLLASLNNLHNDHVRIYLLQKGN